MSRLYARIHGSVVGPFSTDELGARIARKELSPIHELSYDGTTWFRAGKIWDELVPTKIRNRGRGEEIGHNPPPSSALPSAARTKPPLAPATTESSGDIASPDEEIEDDDDAVPAGFAPASRDRELRQIAVVLGCLLVALAFVFCWGLIVDWRTMQSIGATNEGAIGIAREFAHGTRATNVVRLIGEFATWWIFFLWIFKLSEYFHEETGGFMKFSPRWSVGWFFIPVMNFWKPYQVVAELRDKSERFSGKNLRHQLPFPIVPMWWTAWVASFLSYRYLSGYENLRLRMTDAAWESKAQELSHMLQLPVVLKNALLIEMLCLLLNVAAALLTLVLVYEIEALRPRHVKAREDVRPDD